MSEIWKVGMAVGVAIAVIVSAIYVIGGIQSSTAGFRGGVEKKERVVGDGDYRIAQYDHFYELCSAIQAKNENIENLEALRDASDKDRREELDAAIAAQKNTKNELVQEYNADAAANGTKGKYRASELPYQIDPDDEEVSCGS